MKPVVETLIATVRNENTTPLFCPAIYDLKAKLADSDPADYARRTEDLVAALEKEISLLDLKVITSAYDIYNIEAEAAGARLIRKGHNMPYIESPLIDSPENICRLKKIKRPSGRMNIFIEAAKTLLNSCNPGIYIRCGISGPFSMASKIYPGDKLLADCILNASAVKELMQYCTGTIKVYLEGILRNGIDVVIFDSYASPPLISPEIYRELVFPFHKELFDLIAEYNIEYKPLILGGNSYLLDDLIKTGANSFLLDYNIDDNIREPIISGHKDFAFRINIDPAIINGDKLSLAGHMEYFLDRFGRYKNLIIGTGILPYNTPFEKVKEVNGIINEYFS